MYRLLIAEDEKPLLDKMTGNVDWEGEGYNIYQAANGIEALDIVKNQNIDILVTDIKMPGMDGMELIQAVRELNKKIKIIIISGHAEFEYAQKSIRLGVDDYLLKPFRSRKLLLIVEETKEKIRKEKERKEELEDLREELSEYIRGRQLADLLLEFNDEDLFEKHAVILSNERLFTDLKTGSQQEIFSDIQELVADMKELQPDRRSLLILINNIILLTFKSLKEIGFADLHDFVKALEKEMVYSLDLEEIEGWLKSFFSEINKLIMGRRGSQNEELILKIKDYINSNYAEGISLSEIADKFNISAGYLSQLFLKHVGKNFIDYLNLIRINRAKELLKSTDKRIYEIADQVGFNDSYYFSSWFKKIVGVSPTTYRENIDLL